MADGPLLRVRRLCKAFPGVQALAEVSLGVEAGTVHALMGENGAGKSTLARILAGLERADSGEVFLRGRRVAFRGPCDALRAGVSMIHQELLPFADLTVEANLFMGREITRTPLGLLDRAAMRREAGALLERVGARISPDRRMGTLSVAEMQSVEIARAVARRADLILMDEPTSALSAHEVEALFALIDELRSAGAAVLYVTHRLEEVFRLAETVTVLRDGRHVATCPAGELDADRLIALMVGRELEGFRRRRRAATRAAAAGPVLSVRGLGRTGRFADVSFDVRAGEVLGIAGLVGAGRSDVLGALFGLAPADAGEIRLAGRTVRIAHPADALRCGIALVSEDRRRLGLVGGMSVEQNLTLSSLRRFCRGPFVRPGREGRAADEQIRRFGIRAPDRARPVGLLSGGNQQKVVLAKALLTDPKVLLLDEPTRGIDVGARAEIYALIDRLAGEGLAVVLVSSDLPEVLSLSDRLLVMRRGRIVAEMDPRSAGQEDILRRAMLP